MADEGRVPARGRNVHLWPKHQRNEQGARPLVHLSPQFRGGYPMRTLHLLGPRLILAAVVCLIFPCLVMAADESTPNKEQIKHFLLTAKVVGSKQSVKGVTQPWTLTLSDGTLTHDASFQPIDEHKTNVTLEIGRA